MRAFCILLAVIFAVPELAQSSPNAGFQESIRNAQRAQSRGDFSQAAAEYEHALQVRPDSAELWANAGLMRYQLGDFAAAAKSFNEALRLKPGLFVPTLFVGLSYLELNRPREAVGYLSRAATANVKDRQAPLALGRAHFALKQYADANQWFRRAAESDPTNGDAWYGAGMSYLELAEHAGRVLASEHKDSAYFRALAAATLDDQGRFGSAVAQYRRVLASTDAPRCSRTELGFAMLGRHEADGAEQEFRTDLRDGCAAARLGLARLEFERGYDAEAMRLVEQVAAADAGFVQAHAHRLWDGLPDAQAAVVQAKTVAIRQQAVPRSSASHPITAGAAYEKGRYKLCSDALRARLPQLQRTELLLLSTCSFATGDYGTTAAASARLTREHPHFAAGWYWVVKADQKLAVEALARAGEADPTSPRMHLLLGDAYRQKDLFREARAEYGKALNVARDRFPALLGLAATAYRESSLDEALSTIMKALELRPKDPEANLLAGEIIVAQRNYAAAEPFVRASFGAKPAILPRVHALLGRIYIDTGRTKEALVELKQGVASDDDGSVYYQLGRAYQSLGDQRAAEAAMERSKVLRSRRLDLAQEALQAGRQP